MDEISIFRNESKLRGRDFKNIWFGNRPEFCLFNEIQRYVGLRPVFNISRDTCVFPSLSVALTFLWAFVVCVVVTSPLFRQEQAHPKWPGELIGILPLARSSERAVNRDLTVVEFSSRTTPLTGNADAFVS